MHWEKDQPNYFRNFTGKGVSVVSHGVIVSHSRKHTPSGEYAMKVRS